jgi:phosphopantetheine adenylyltransferase
VKRADASRIYGLELEEIFSPDKVSFLVGGDTLIEEHIIGIPCDEFIKKNKGIKIENRLRFAKEFVKFNERCFTRLLGDMRAYNFVVEITQDFDTVQYRIRAIDFDQQSYEGRKSIYLPQYFKDNIALVDLATELLSRDVAEQYTREEHDAMRKRYSANYVRMRSLMSKMRKDKISTQENIKTLRRELGKFHQDASFEKATNMAEILVKHLEHQLS